jgi:hypothetical protein
MTYGAGKARTYIRKKRKKGKQIGDNTQVFSFFSLNYFSPLTYSVFTSVLVHVTLSVEMLQELL